MNAGATGNLPPGKPGIALTITLISATKQAGINGGEKTGSERISAITTILDSTISLCRWPFCRISKPNQLPLLVCQCSIKTKRIPTLKIIDGFTPRDYLTHWLSQWVRDYGIDGFRVDTAKHVELPAWQQLKTEASAALREWKKANPDKALDDKPFWMTGEAWGHGVMQSDYYRHGFDAMINFDYQEQAAKAVDCLAQMDTTWQQMAEKLQDFNVLSYLSSHDTRLFREGGDKAAELLLLAPGAVQIFYGDESSRPFGPTGSDPLQGTRSDMNWQDVSGKSAASVAHWQKISQFRARHPAIGAGKQTTLSLKQGYGFVREHGDDKVLVIWAGQQ